MPKQKHKLTTTDCFSQGHTRAELADLAKWERLMTSDMGGIFPERSDPDLFPRILDIGCGTGSWAIDAALTYPTLLLVGIDIDPSIIDYAHNEAERVQISERVAFHLMDALKPLAFADASFDLVNFRLGSSFVRTWEWPCLLQEVRRVLRPKGVIRFAELELVSQSSSAVVVQFARLLANAFFHAGHFFEPEVTGITAHLEGLLQNKGYQHIQRKEIKTVLSAYTENGQAVSESTLLLFPPMQSFIEKWIPGDEKKAYADLNQHVFTDMQQDASFFAELHFLIVWGSKVEIPPF